MNQLIASIFTNIPETIVIFFHDTIGLGWGPAIVAFTFTVQLAILPIWLAQIHSMRTSQAPQPETRRGRINQLSPYLALLLQIPVFISLYYMLNGDSFQYHVMSSPPEGWLFIPSLIQPPEAAIAAALAVLSIITQLASGLMTVQTQRIEAPQRYVFYALPFLFAPFVLTLDAGMAVYWISANLWMLVQQKLVHHVFDPKAEQSPNKPIPIHVSEVGFGSRVLPLLADALSHFGYVLGSQTDRVAFFTRRHSPWYFWLVYVLFFPAGLLLLLARPTQTLSATWASESPTSTNLLLAGPDRRLDRITQITAQRLSPGAAATEPSVGLQSPQDPTPTPSARSFCRACGERLRAADAFCGGCGASQ